MNVDLKTLLMMFLEASLKIWNYTQSRRLGEIEPWGNSRRLDRQSVVYRGTCQRRMGPTEEAKVVKDLWSMTSIPFRDGNNSTTYRGVATQ